MLGCGMVVDCGTVRMAISIRGPSSSGVVAMGIAMITTLHSREMGKPELPPSLEAESSSLVDSSRMSCSVGNPL
jgi:hypothetical protein